MSFKLKFYSLSLFFLFCLLLFAIVSCKKDKKVAPPTVSTGAVTNINSSSATVGGTIIDNGNEAIQESGVVYSANITLPTIADNKLEIDLTQGTSTGSFSAVLENLISGTTYHIRAYATNSAGTSYGDAIDFMTENGAPSIASLIVKGTPYLGETLTADYAYQDPEGDAEAATTFQWYVASSSTGADETLINGAISKTFVIQAAQDGKFIRVSVTPKAATGTTTGVEVKSSYTTAVGTETVTFNYNGSSVTYGTIVSLTTQKKWLDRNLGASRLAQSVDDYLAYGDLFQWGRLADGHQLITRTGVNNEDAFGVTGTTSTSTDESSNVDVPITNKFIIASGPSTIWDWRFPQNNNLWQGVNGINNPCPSGWRVPTHDELAAEAFINAQDAFNKLKLTYSGFRRYLDGLIYNSQYGYYWSSTVVEMTAGTGKYASLYAVISSFNWDVPESDFTFHASAAQVRCIKDF